MGIGIVKLWEIGDAKAAISMPLPRLPERQLLSFMPRQFF
jgi:hypothetical protein